MQQGIEPDRSGSERNFYTFVAIALIVAVFAGFSRTFFLKPLFPEAEALSPPEPYFYFHGIVFCAWMLLFAAQAWLIRARRAAIHRKLGVAGAGLAVAVVLTGVYGALLAANRPGGFIGVPFAPEAFLLVPLLDVGIFALFVFLAIEWRSDTQSHKRLMLLATLSICQAAFIRIPPSSLGEFAGPIVQMSLTTLVLAALAIWDFRSQRRIHPITLWAGIPFLISQPLRIPVAQTEAWQKLGRLAMSLI